MTKYGAVSNFALIAIAFLFNVGLLLVLTDGPFTLEVLPKALYLIFVYALIPALLMLAATAWIKQFSAALLFFVCLTIVPVLLMTRGHHLDRDGAVVIFLMQFLFSYGSAILLVVFSFVLWIRNRRRSRRYAERWACAQEAGEDRREEISSN